MRISWRGPHGIGGTMPLLRHLARGWATNPLLLGSTLSIGSLMVFAGPYTAVRTDRPEFWVDEILAFHLTGSLWTAGLSMAAPFVERQESVFRRLRLTGLCGRRLGAAMLLYVLAFTAPWLACYPLLALATGRQLLRGWDLLALIAIPPLVGSMFGVLAAAGLLAVPSGQPLRGRLRATAVQLAAAVGVIVASTVIAVWMSLRGLLLGAPLPMLAALFFFGDALDSLASRRR